MRHLLDLGLLDDGRRGAGAGGRGQLALVRVDDRVGQLVLLGLAAALEVVVERGARLLDLLVGEHADREQEALLVVGGDLVGGQWLCANVTHCTFSSSSGSGT